MSEKEKQGWQPQAVPFFARFLEGQGTEELSDDEMQAIAGGKKQSGMTMKYPSDGDELVTTLKYPSDGDDGELK
jgi:bacteriocin-like protein